MVEVMKIMVISFKISQAFTATLSAPNLAAGHHQPMPLLETPGHSQGSLGQSLAGSLLLSPGAWGTTFCLCPLGVYFSVLCNFWQLYGGINCNSSKRVYGILKSAAPRAPVPAAVLCWPIPPQEMPTHSSMSVSVGSLGPGVHKVCLSPLTIFWWEWGLVLNMSSPLLPSCWGFSFALVHGDISSQSLQSLPSYWGFSDLGHGVSPLGHSRLCSQHLLLQCHAGFPVHHQLLELTQTHVHWVGDTIQPSHPLSSPFPPAFNLS